MPTDERRRAPTRGAHRLDVVPRRDGPHLARARTAHAASTAALLALAGCAEPMRPPTPPGRDAGTAVANDGGLLAVTPDAGPRDAAAPSRDASTSDGGPSDAATPGVPRIDGVVDDAEWLGAVEARSTIAPSTATPDDTLRVLRVIRGEDQLFVALEGTIGAGHAVLLYVDRDLGTERGALLSGAPFADASGELDRALSVPLLSAVPGLRPEFAWGSARMPTEGPTGGDDAVGWREVASRPTDFLRVEGPGVVSACGALACEAVVPLALLGAGSADTLGLFARIGTGAGSLTNQALPSDDPSSVAVVLAVPALTTTGTSR